MYTWYWCWTARVWAWMRQHDLSNRAFKDEADIDQACAESWNKLTPERLRSITATQWLAHEKQAGCVSVTALCVQASICNAASAVAASV